jgi:hypothetical protein
MSTAFDFFNYKLNNALFTFISMNLLNFGRLILDILGEKN